MRGQVRLRAMRRGLLGWGRGVYVIGMHRSGTSAVTRVINLMGIPLGDRKDLIQAADNPAGHWESARLTAVNDRLLEELGGSWMEPPRLEPGWERRPGLRSLRSLARRRFAQTYPGSLWLWKDPRNCLTLPFWRSVLEAHAAVVLVLRHPLEIASSMQARNGLPIHDGLALWERYMRSALAAIEDMPVLATTYEGLLAEPAAWSDHMAAFLQEQGFSVKLPKGAVLAGFVDPELRHSSVNGSAGALSEPQARLYSALLEQCAGQDQLLAAKLA